MAIGQNWSNIAQTSLAIVLAFFFGYLLTFRNARKKGLDSKSFAKVALATDTVSITSMEIIDNAIEWLIPGAINSRINSGLFWWSLAIALAVAFMLTVPVNRFLIRRGIGHSHEFHS